MFVVAVTISLFWSISSVAAQEWARFRGPNGLGINETANLPATWNDDDYNWRVELPGPGNSSPVVFDDMVYVTSGNEEDGTQIISCLKTSDGSEVWRKNIKARTYEKHAFNQFATSTPTVDDKCLYVAFANPEEFVVASLDRITGKKLWSRHFVPAITRHGFGCSPILFEDMLIITREQEEWDDDPAEKESVTEALNRRTGKTDWISGRKTASAAYSTPCLYRPKDGRPQLIYSSQADGIFSIDPTTGKRNWELAVLDKRVVGSPLVVGDLIFASCGAGGGGSKMVAVKPGDSEKDIEPEVAFEIEGTLPYVPTPIAHDGLLFLWADKGIVSCLDAKTGRRHWRERVGGNFFGSPVYASGRLYCMSRDGVMTVVEAKKEFQPPVRIELGEPTSATPAISGGAMYLRTRSHLMSIGGKNP